MNDKRFVDGCIVVKFGGSSLADGNLISKAAKSVAKEVLNGERIVVVVSAMGKTTDYLIENVKEASYGNFSGRDMDDVLAMGERTSARIFSTAIKAHGVNCLYLDPEKPCWPIITDNKTSNANPILPICKRSLKKSIFPLLKEGVTIVIPGFIGKTQNGTVTTMGRGCSDTTALIVADALNAKQVIFVTDVDGIMTADPKIVGSARKIKRIDINSLIGLADSGIKFIHKKALKYKNPNINIKVINHKHNDLRVEGTMVFGSIQNELTVNLAYPEPITAVSIVGDPLSNSPQILYEVIQTLTEADIQILGMSSNYDSVILYLPGSLSDKIFECLHFIVIKNEKSVAMAIRKNIAYIKVKGIKLEETPGIIEVISKTLSSKNINILGIFTITSSVQIFIDMDNADTAIEELRNIIKEIRG